MNTTGTISVHSTSLNLGPSLTEHVKGSITKFIDRYFNKLIRADVHFDAEREYFHSRVKIQVHGFGEGIGESNGPNCYKAFNSALNHAVIQLIKRKNGRIRSKVERPHKLAFLNEGLGPPMFGA